MSETPEPGTSAPTPESLLATPAVVAISTLLAPMAVLQAVADPTRWGIVRELSAGQPLPVRELAERLRRDPDVVSRHLSMMLDAGVVTVRQDSSDGRKRLYTIPEPCQRSTEAGQRMVDYGSCLLRFS
jgi:DNA-binding transcriptional ArsR family regulator